MHNENFGELADEDGTLGFVQEAVLTVSIAFVLFLMFVGTLLITV